MPAEEIAKILGVTPGAVKQLLFRAKIHLRNRLKVSRTYGGRDTEFFHNGAFYISGNILTLEGEITQETDSPRSINTRL